MTDDGLGPVEVTGRWVGFYRCRSEHLGLFPLVADLRQTGDKITGEMNDQITDVTDRLILLGESPAAYWSSRRPIGGQPIGPGLPKGKRSPRSSGDGTKSSIPVTLTKRGSALKGSGSSSKGDCSVGSCRHKVGAASSSTRSLETGIKGPTVSPYPKGTVAGALGGDTRPA